MMTLAGDTVASMASYADMSTSAESATSVQLPLRVLVVDDNHDAAESMAVLLSLLGSEVRICHDGIEAVKTFSEFLPQAVLLDIGLPRLDGHAAARQMRSQPGSDSIVFIALSGYGRDEDRQRSREAGFNYHIVKPVAPETLIDLLSTITGSEGSRQSATL